ncbi:MAG TPA: extracellular solute-binding protein [Bacillales bacterium]
MKKQWFRLSALLLVLMLVLTACSSGGGSSKGTSGDGGGSGDSGSDSPKEVTLSLTHTLTDSAEKDTLEILNEIVSTVEEKTPGVTFELSGIDGEVFRNQKLPAAMSTGTTPDVFDLFGGSDTQRYAKAGKLLDLTPILEELGWQDRFLDLSSFTVDGKVYGLPIAVSAEGFFYNKKMVGELGLSVPKTWDDLLNFVTKAKAAGKIPISMASKAPWVPGMLLNAIIIHNVGIDNFKGLTTGEYKWTNDQMLKAFKEFQKLVDMGAFPEGNLGIPYPEMASYMIRGDAVMEYTGSWDAKLFFKDKVGDLKGNTGFFMFPSVPGGQGVQDSMNVNFANGWGFSADVTDAQKKAIKTFIKVAYSDKFVKERLKTIGYLSPVKLKDVSGLNPLMSDITKTMEKSSKWWPAYDAIVNDKVHAAFNTGIQQMLGGVKTPEEIVKHLQEVTNQSSQ